MGLISDIGDAIGGIVGGGGGGSSDDSGGQTEGESRAPSVSDPGGGGGGGGGDGGGGGSSGGSSGGNSGGSTTGPGGGGGGGGVPSYDLGGGGGGGQTEGESRAPKVSDPPGSGPDPPDNTIDTGETVDLGGGGDSGGGGGGGGGGDFEPVRNPNATVETAVRDTLPELNQQVDGRDLDRTDVQVGRDEGGDLVIRPRPGPLERLNQNDLAAQPVQQQTFGRVTDTTTIQPDAPTARELNAEPGFGGGDGFQIAQPGPDFPTEPTVQDAVDAVDGDDALVETDIPVTRDNQREFVSNNLQRAVGIDPQETQAPLRSGIEAGKDEFAKQVGIQQDGTIDLDEAEARDSGPLAAGAGVAIAAPEPVSTTAGTSILAGIGLGSAGVAAADEVFGDDDEVAQSNQDVNELNIPEGVPGDAVVELDLPDDRTPADTRAELGTPEGRPTETGGELEVPEGRTPTDTGGELGTPEADDSTPGVDAPIEAQQLAGEQLPEEDDEEEDLDEDPFADRGRVQERRQQERNEIARQTYEQTLFEQRERFGEEVRESVPTDADPFTGEVPADQTPQIPGVGEPTTFGEREETFEERFNREVLEESEEQQPTRQRLRERQRSEETTDEIAELREESQTRFDARNEGDQLGNADTGVGPRGDTGVDPRAAAATFLGDLLSAGESELFDNDPTDTDEVLDEITDTEELNDVFVEEEATPTATTTLFPNVTETQQQTQNTTTTTVAPNRSSGRGRRRPPIPELPELEGDDDDLADLGFSADSDTFGTGITDPGDVLDDAFGGEQ